MAMGRLFTNIVTLRDSPSCYADDKHTLECALKKALKFIKDINYGFNKCKIISVNHVV